MGKKMDKGEFQKIVGRLVRIVSLQESTLRMVSDIPQIFSGMWEEEVGLILNDSIGSWSYVDTPKFPNRFMMRGERTGALIVKPCATGITIEDEDSSHPMYYTLMLSPVIEENSYLKCLWPEYLFEFIYGITDRKYLSTNCIYYLAWDSAKKHSCDTLVVRTSPARHDPNTVRHEFLWGDGEIYALDCQLNKPIAPEYVKRIEKSTLSDFSL
jgi:hypothetical protein